MTGMSLTAFPETETGLVSNRGLSAAIVVAAVRCCST